MVKLIPAGSRPLVFDSFIPPLFVVISLLTISIVSIGLVPFATGVFSAPSARRSADAALIFEWINKTGHPTVMRANVAHAFGLANRDLPVNERGFRLVGEQPTHVCSIHSGPGNERLMFLATVDEGSGRATIWRMSGNGDLLATVVIGEGGTERLPDAHFASGFETELDYFVKKARSSSFPADGSLAPPGGNLGRKVELPDSPASAGASIPLSSEATLIALNPLVLPAIIGALATAAFARKSRGPNCDSL